MFSDVTSSSRPASASKRTDYLERADFGPPAFYWSLAALTEQQLGRRRWRVSGFAFRLDQRLDPRALRSRFSEKKRLHIKDFLQRSDAERLYQSLRMRDDWRLVVNQKEKLFELDRSAQAMLTPDSRAALERAAHASARYDFQFLFETIRVPDDEAERRARPSELNRFASFMSSPEVIDLLRHVTGCDDIDFADAQATAYSPGHFLTVHDDDVAGKHRHAAYVLNLSPAWRPDWGGLLAFHRADEDMVVAFPPSFNALNIFSVPQPHSVTMVAPFAAARRYSVTGWLRSRSASP